jgi:hypothetical protein
MARLCVGGDVKQPITVDDDDVGNLPARSIQLAALADDLCGVAWPAAGARQRHARHVHLDLTPERLAEIWACRIGAIP